VKRKTPFGLKALIVLLLGVLALLGTLFLLIRIQESDIAALEKSIADMKAESIALRFMVLSRDQGEMTFKLKLYDADGTELSSMQESLPGQSLFIDFVSVPVAGSYLAFPHRVFTEKIAAVDGISLFGLYDSDGFPEVFARSGLDPKALRALKALFGKVKSGDLPRTAFGNAVHDVKELGSFEPGLIYKVVSRKLGGLEIMEDER
jgi:hypothetical protein